jgi:ribosomal protein L13
VGGLKTRTVKDQLERAPEEVLRKAVQRMLPDNKLRVVRF